MTATTARPASDKQRAFALRLLTEKALPAEYEGIADLLRESYEHPSWTTVQASAAIDWLLALPSKSAADAAQPGYYVREGAVYVVVQAKTTGNLYAKVLRIEDGRGSWEYAPGVHRNLRDSERLTVEEAARLGHLHGVCMVCGRRLTQPASVERGIGPVCAKRL